MSTLFSAIQWPFGIAVGTAVGGAAGGAITPVVQDIVNEAWAAHPQKPLAAALAATLAAELYQGGHADAGEAAQTGYDSGRFEALVEAARRAPDVGMLLILYRRGLISRGDFEHGLAKAKLDGRYFGPVETIADVLLSPAELANARQQEFIDDARLHDEGGKQGYSSERMDLLYRMAGLPPGAMDALTLLRRGLIDTATYRAIVAEGHTKTKYTDALLGLRYNILPAREWASLWLRGWASESEAKAGGALDGYDAAAMDRLYQNRGRPATVRQTHIGFARGGRLPGAGNDEQATIRRSVEESNIRTEWFDILYAQRFTYPSAFVLRALAQDGTFTQAETEQILLEVGWRPDYAATVSAKWASTTAGTTAKWLDRARSRLFTVAHNEFLDGSISAAEAHALVVRVGAGAAEADAIIALWEAELGVARLELTPTQIKKAYRRALYDLPTALAELEERGMTPADADVFLQS